MATIEAQSNRQKLLAPYEGFVKIKLEQYPDTGAAQMHDWLKEHYDHFPEVSPKTVYNFVMWVRQQHNIPLTGPQREYCIVEELPYGQQAQVDFGEYNMRNTEGKRIKIYFFYGPVPEPLQVCLPCPNTIYFSSGHICPYKGLPVFWRYPQKDR